MATGKLGIEPPLEDSKLNEEAQALPKERALTSGDIDRGQAFYLAEYESLRAEILQTITDSRNLERNIVFAVGVSLAWIMSHRNVHPLVWFLPLALVLVERVS